MASVNHPVRPQWSAPFMVVLYVILVLLAAAVLAPWTAKTGQWLLSVLPADGSPLGWLRSEIVKADFARYFTRSAQLIAAVLLWPMIRLSGMTASLLPSWRPCSRGLRRYGVGFALAAGLLLLLGAALVSMEIFRWRASPSWWQVGGPITAALGAGVLEEIFFRGFLLGLFLTALRPGMAVFLTTFLFALVHFLRPPEDWQLPLDQLDAWSGFQVLAGIFASFGDWNFLVAEFATLFAVGWVLARARMQTGQLWLSMGLHGGWIFGLQYFSGLTGGSKALKAGEFLPWIGSNLKIGVTPLLVILITGLLIRPIRDKVQRPHPDNADIL